MNPTAPELREYHNPVTGYKWHAECVNGLWCKFIEHPGVYLVASMQLHEGDVNEYLRDHQITKFSPWGVDGEGGHDHNARGTDSDLLVELSGRICYMSYDRPRPGGLDAFIANLKSEGHGSVFEHPHYSFILSGVSRNLTLEANRHRPFSISQLSGRFVDGSEVGFVLDDQLDGVAAHQWKQRAAGTMREYQIRYRENYEREKVRAWKKTPLTDMPDNCDNWIPDRKTERKLVKTARERARDILPGALETRVMYTVNARAIRFIFEKRCHADAAWEIRRAFNGVYRVLQKHEPRLFADYREAPLDDGTFAVSTDCPKV